MSRTILDRAPKDNALLCREIAIIDKFIAVYCKRHHSGASSLCDDCRELREYAISKLEECPYEPKPPCKRCPTHCYTSIMRKKIKDIMRFSGMHFIKRGRLDWLLKYFMTSKPFERSSLKPRTR